MHEFDLIRKYFSKLSKINKYALELNDDVFFDKKKSLVISIDTYNQGTHFLDFKNPELVILNKNLSKELNLDFSNVNNKKISELFSGNSLPPGSNSIAQAYAGHQFGHFTMLGDGRAVLIGEHLSKKKSRYDIHLCKYSN